MLTAPSLQQLTLLCRWYKGLTPKTRAIMGVGVMAYACLGMYASDVVEEKTGLTPTEKEKQQLRDALPKIIVVDRENR